ncbi:23S rRNA (adenine(2503)-C(2))-methyltransferase RlmN [Egicoccus halophilus]|uniref:Probable dual-specificity RNA methyltransferase RlmN n=1 Tax=Egicoccus halophilus TaxID=1670830 RepID=A0A8J3AAJ5_9ACTN|nr:23S rRNA (adenine(2503)-C(2))-methyltransferase RlmN [Egicoccus halophilus]GGI06512.1 putative dual-specificity RNA methyltransferase RlmN [Egicoccus halophilus]
MSESAAVDPYALSRDELTALLADLDQPRYRADQLHAWLVRGIDDPQEMTDLPVALREQLAERFAPARPELVAHTVADDGHTHKLLLRYPDGEAIETVLMLYPKRATVCISTQAGCAMGCPFCATGQAGFRRQLTAGEVVRQVVVADAALRGGGIGDQQIPDGAPDHVTNVVFMGMGEPLANLSATLATVRWLHDPDGFNLSARGITVSTVGLVPGIRKLADLGLPLTLAVSLHAATDDLRDELVPVNVSHPLAELEATVREYRERTNRRVTIEWCLIGDVNDDDRQADELARIARRLRAHVNVIPMNPTPGVRWKEPSRGRTRAFVDRVRRGGVEITLRDTRGRDADAACGQLLATYTLGAGSRLPAAVGAADRVDLLQVPDGPRP